MKNDKGSGVGFDGSGNTYVTGNFSGTIDFDPGPDSVNLSSLAFSNDIFMAKYSASGSFVYAKAIGGVVSDISSGIAVDSAGNVFLAGSFQLFADFDPGAGTKNLFSAGPEDMFIAKYDPSGNYVYAKAMGGNKSDYVKGIAADRSGNAYVTGSFQGIAEFDRGSGADSSVLEASAFNDIFIAKFSQPSPLPVQLLSFQAKAASNGAMVQVAWSTASLMSNAWFYVERSTDGAQFETIGQRQGCSTCTGEQHYLLADHDPYSGISYYRLKLVDHDQQFTYSHVVLVNITRKINTNIRVYPSITEGDFQAVINSDQPQKRVIVRLFNATGSLVNEQPIQLLPGTNMLHYSLSGHAAGVYYIIVSDKKDQLFTTEMVIKN